MSRSSVPSSMQVQKLVQLIDEKRFLATGHARTTHARDKTRAAWEEIAIKLNSENNGCVKSWQQWAKKMGKTIHSGQREIPLKVLNFFEEEKKRGLFVSPVDQVLKRTVAATGIRLSTIMRLIRERKKQIILQYWKDKKAAIKKKVSLIRTARLEAGGGEGEQIILSSLEERVVSLIGGEDFTVGDSELEINPLHCLQEESTYHDESIVQQPLPGPSTSREGYCDNISQDHHPSIETTSPQPAVPHSSRTAFLSPRRRRPLTARRRLLTRTSPSQRQSMLARLTERFIALKEKRLENERLLFENQDKMFNIFMEVNKSMSRQTQALQELCSATKALAEKINRN